MPVAGRRLEIHGSNWVKRVWKFRNGALGIDEWVKADGGNAYSLVNFEWISVGDKDKTQLIACSATRCNAGDPLKRCGDT